MGNNQCLFSAEEPTVIQYVDVSAGDQLAQAELGSNRRSLWRRPWMFLLVLLVGAFLADELPPYLTLDRNASRVVIDPEMPSHYPLLLGHIGFGSIALITVALQVWPWLRRNHPAIHRFSGRMYVFAGALPSGILALSIVPMIPEWRGTLGIVVHAVLWLGTTIAGYVSARRRRWAAHRKWMLYSFALALGVLWGRSMVLIVTNFAPGTDVNYIFEVARWFGWMVNLFAVQWWLDRTSRHPAPQPAQPSGGFSRHMAATTPGCVSSSRRPSPHARSSRCGSGSPRSLPGCSTSWRTCRRTRWWT